MIPVFFVKGYPSLPNPFVKKGYFNCCQILKSPLNNDRSLNFHSHIYIYIYTQRQSQYISFFFFLGTGVNTYLIIKQIVCINYAIIQMFFCKS